MGARDRGRPPARLANGRIAIVEIHPVSMTVVVALHE